MGDSRVTGGDVIIPGDVTDLGGVNIHGLIPAQVMSLPRGMSLPRVVPPSLGSSVPSGMSLSRGMSMSMGTSVPWGMALSGDAPAEGAVLERLSWVICPST